jgi:hypothetical protein
VRRAAWRRSRNPPLVARANGGLRFAPIRPTSCAASRFNSGAVMRAHETSIAYRFSLDSTNACEAGRGSAPRETLTPELPLAGQRRQIQNRTATCAACEESLQHPRLLSDSMVVHMAGPVTRWLPLVVQRARALRQETGQENSENGLWIYRRACDRDRCDRRLVCRPPDHRWIRLLGFAERLSRARRDNEKITATEVRISVTVLDCHRNPGADQQELGRERVPHRRQSRSGGNHRTVSASILSYSLWIPKSRIATAPA